MRDLLLWPSSARIYLGLMAMSMSVFYSTTTLASPYVPADDQQIVAQLPNRIAGPALHEIKSLRQQHVAQPENLTIRQALIQRYIEQSRHQGDPRYLGYAAALLIPWQQSHTLPASLRLLRAIIHQSNHDFDKALADLDQVIQQDPHQAQAWLTRATIYQVQGRYVEAKADCRNLLLLATRLISFTCLAESDSLSGHAKASIALLNQAPITPDDSQASQSWRHTVLAEMNERLGLSESAESAYQAALQIMPDAYTQGAYADFLLDQRRYRDVIQLLENETLNDALLLRLAIAQQQSGHPQAKAAETELDARFAEATLRGDTVHQREAARYWLVIKNQPRQALALAKQNFSVQREPADIRILLQAAKATHDKAALEQVRRYIEQTGIEDVRLTR